MDNRTALGYFSGAMTSMRCLAYVTATKKNVTISTKKLLKCITEPFQTTISYTWVIDCVLMLLRQNKTDSREVNNFTRPAICRYVNVKTTRKDCISCSAIVNIQLSVAEILGQ